MAINSLTISLARTKWRNFVEVVRKNELQLMPEDWNIIYSLCEACKSCPETVLSEIKKLENKYFEKYTDIPKNICSYPSRRAISMLNLDPIPKGSK